MASPAMQPSRPTGLVDFRKHAEYPIVLGDSLKDDPASAEQLIDLRYNWQPKVGLKDFESTLRKHEDGYRLIANDTTSSDTAYRYAGHDRQLRSNGDKMESFALVFDKKRSVFVLESITHSIDLNLDAAASQSKDDIRRRPQLSKVSLDSSTSKKAQDDDEADPNNPFDFRNFLDEAKETVEKANGSKSPILGARTPMSGFASPAAGPTRFTPTVSQALPKDSHHKATQNKIKSDPPKRKPKPAQERKPATTRQPNQPLSNERISDSDDELSDAPVIKESKPAATAATAPPPAPSKGHSRNISANIGASPHIVVNDGDLEIDMGSPPQEAKARKRRIDAGAFRSHTGTPVIGQSPRIANAVAPSSSSRQSRDIEMKDVSRRSVDDDEDDDVDELELGSPRAQSVGRKSTGSVVQHQHRDEAPPTPPKQSISEDDEVAELEDLLGGEDDDADTSAGAGLGLGISGTSHHQQQQQDDDDSEVSEEE